MDSSTLSGGQWKQPLNICRCCLADGCYKDISTEYYFSGRKEVFETMLKDTFDVEISYQEGGGPSRASRLICEECIMKLRDAFTFKHMVLQSEDSFVSYLDGLISGHSDGNKIPECEMKLDPVKVEVLAVSNVEFDLKHGDENCGDFDDNCSCDDDEILADIKVELTRGSGPVARRTRRLKRPPEAKRKKRNKVKDVDDDILDTLKTTKTEKNWLKIAERRGNGPILRENSLKLLEHSTICVFQWDKSRYRCFCCKEPFSDVALLRHHTSTNHTLEDIEKKIIIQQNRLVKVEVSTLFCKICSCQLENLATMRDHLSRTHKIQFELEEDLLVPFKIDSGNLQCQICTESFAMFRLLNIHMNKHYQKQVCHICGAGFSNLVFLNLHKTRSHRPFTCKLCGLVFTNRIDKKDHDVSVHDVKIERKLRFPCPYCNDRFFQENFRVLHLVEKHGLKKPEHKCLMCSKVFITRSLCNNHMKNVHMKEKNQECDVCHHLFYTKSDVVRHRVTHTGEKKFCCSLCSSLFATKDSLRRHMKRTHVGGN